MAKAVFPGSFDPFTVGHLDVALKASKMFDQLVIYVGVNTDKKPMFTLGERIAMISEAVKNYPNIAVTGGSDIIVNYCTEIGASTLVKSFRSYTDVEYENKIAAINKALNENIETAFVVADPKYSHISSSYVKVIMELDRTNPEISYSVPPVVYGYLLAKM